MEVGNAQLVSSAAHCYYFYLVRRYPKVLSFGRSFLTAPDFQSSMSNTRLPGISLSFSFYIFFAYLLSILFKFLLGLQSSSKFSKGKFSSKTSSFRDDFMRVLNQGCVACSSKVAV